MPSTTTVNIGKIGFTWKGVYSASTSYTVWDTFLYNNSVYLCIADASAGTSPDNTSYFTCVSHGLVGKGEYNSANTYDINSIVTNGNTAYIAKESGITGTWDSTKWMAIPTYIPESSVSIAYNTVEADNDLIALWSVINSATEKVDGTFTHYGMTELSAGSAVLELNPSMPSLNCAETYFLNTSAPLSRLPYYDIPCLALADGDEVTLSFLKWIGTESRSTGSRLLGIGMNDNSPMTASEHALLIDDGVSYDDDHVFFTGVASSTGIGGDNSYTNFLASSGNTYSSNYLRMNNLNDFTITIKRTGDSYTVNLFVNGTLARNNTATNSNHFNFTKFYLGYLCDDGNSLNYHENRGIAQLAIYQGLKYTANYTPTYALLKKTV